jgi:hypothetical protein
LRSRSPSADTRRALIGAINLDDEARARRMEGSDEHEQRNLPPKRDTELARAQYPVRVTAAIDLDDEARGV